MTPQKSDDELYAARQRAIDAMPAIIDKIIEEAKLKGSCPHAKFLLEFALGDAASAPAVPGDEQSLAAMLLKELREEPAA
jgi:hypothetical protein